MIDDGSCNHEKYWQSVNGKIVGFAIVRGDSETINISRYILIDPGYFGKIKYTAEDLSNRFQNPDISSELQTLFLTIFWNLILPDIQLIRGDLFALQSKHIISMC